MLKLKERKKKQLSGRVHSSGLALKDSVPQEAGREQDFQEAWAVVEEGLSQMEGAKVRQALGLFKPESEAVRG